MDITFTFHPMHANRRAVWLVSLLSLAVASPAAAQTSVQFLLVQETHNFDQTGTASTVETIGPKSPWTFQVSLEGSNLSAFTGSLSFTSPSGSETTSGTASYDSKNDHYSYTSGFSTFSALNAAFAGGTYDVNYNGTHVPLTLSGNLFPAAPIIAISGASGTWVGNQFTIQAGHDLTLSTIFTDAANYGTGNAHVSLSIGGGNNYNNSLDVFATSGQIVISAADLIAGQSYEVHANFAGIMSMSDALSPITSAAIYTSETGFTLTVAVPEPATVVTLLGAAGLAVVVALRIRSRRHHSSPL